MQAIDLDFDAAGNLYVVDAKTRRVKKFFPTGNLLAEWYGEGTPGVRLSPNAIEVTTQGVYVADSSWRSVVKFHHSGAFLTKWGNSGGGPGEFFGPDGIAAAADETLYVTDTPRAASRICATRQGWSKGNGGCDDSMKLRLSSSGCETRPARGEPARAGSEPCAGRGNATGEA